MRPEIPVENRAAMVVAAMTQNEKFAWLSAARSQPNGGRATADEAIGSAGYYPSIPRLGIPAMQQSDASLGVTNPGNVRPGDQATALPASLLLGATFDPDLAYETGALVGREARAKGFNVMLAGGANLIRDPRCGRTFEYVSEDPLLTGVMVGHSIAGIQSQGVVSTIKHFLLNGQETGRPVVSSDLGEAAMRESDLLAFQIGIEIGRPGSVMTSYNLVNGTYTAENPFLIGTVLKGDWGYPGWVMSDWGGTHSAAASALAGLDAESGAQWVPDQFFADLLAAAVAAGRVPQSRIDNMLHRILRSLFAVGVIDDPPRPGGSIDFDAHRLIAQRAAEQGMVLLKNAGNILPASAEVGRILVVGGHAHRGVLAGGGSSQVTPNDSLQEPGVTICGEDLPRTYHPSSPLAAIRAEAPGAQVDYLDGHDVAAAAAAAGSADLVLMFATEWRSEGLDAQGLSLPHAQDRLIDAVATAQPNTVVVLEIGGPVTMRWLRKVPAVLVAFYPGAGGGPAIANVVFGRVNPSGRLPCTFPAAEEQLPRPSQRDPAETTSEPSEWRTHPIFHVDYTIEGADVGYRWFERQDIEPLFPFGFGLSYTDFVLSDAAATPSAGGLAVALTVTNRGHRAGADVPQVYVGRAGKNGFVHRLAGFRRVLLETGERRRIEIAIEPRLLARFDEERQRFVIDGGEYSVRVGRYAGDTTVVLHVELDAAILGTAHSTGSADVAMVRDRDGVPMVTP